MKSRIRKRKFYYVRCQIYIKLCKIIGKEYNLKSNEIISLILSDNECNKNNEFTQYILNKL